MFFGVLIIIEVLRFRSWLYITEWTCCHFMLFIGLFGLLVCWFVWFVFLGLFVVCLVLVWFGSLEVCLVMPFEASASLF